MSMINSVHARDDIIHCNIDEKDYFSHIMESLFWSIYVTLCNSYEPEHLESFIEDITIQLICREIDW
jgi:hypothetical protein